VKNPVLAFYKQADGSSVTIGGVGNPVTLKSIWAMPSQQTSGPETTVTPIYFKDASTDESITTFYLRTLIGYNNISGLFNTLVSLPGLGIRCPNGVSVKGVGDRIPTNNDFFSITVFYE
jgi:hypothetical protein